MQEKQKPLQPMGCSWFLIFSGVSCFSGIPYISLLSCGTDTAYCDYDISVLQNKPSGGISANPLPPVVHFCCVFELWNI